MKASLIKNDKGALGSRLSFLSECSHGLMETEYRGSLSTPQPGAPLGGRASTRAKKKKKQKTKTETPKAKDSNLQGPGGKGPDEIDKDRHKFCTDATT